MTLNRPTWVTRCAFGRPVNRPAQNGTGSGGRRTDDRPANLTRINPAESATLTLRKTGTRNEVTTSRLSVRSITEQAATPHAGRLEG